jgi:hypothetical protein
MLYCTEHGIRRSTFGAPASTPVYYIFGWLVCVRVDLFSFSVLSIFELSINFSFFPPLYHGFHMFY